MTLSRSLAGMLRVARVLFAFVAATVAFAMSSAYAQDTVVRAEALIALQTIPLSRPVTFGVQYIDEEIDHVAWMVMRALDPSNSWNPRHRAWKVYYSNVRHDVHEELRRRWQNSAGAIRSLSQNPDTALARFYADTLSAGELDEALRFYRGEAGRKYTAYLRELTRTYYRGLVELQRIAVDPDYGSPGDSLASRRQKWVQKKGVTLDPPPPDYQFHVSAAQSAFPGAKPMDLVAAVAAGAPPGTEDFSRLHRMLTDEERASVLAFMASAVSEKEARARKLWSDAVAKSRDVAPLIVRDIRSVLSVASKWRKIRADPRALPRSIAELDPATIEVVDEYPTIEVGNARTREFVRSCLPGIAEHMLEKVGVHADGSPSLGMTQTISHSGGNNLFIARGGVGACIPTTAPGYPVPAVSSFIDTVRFAGLAEDQADRLNRTTAQELAVSGASQSIVVLPNANAYAVTYAVNIQSPGLLIYSTRFLRAGSYDTAAYQRVYTVSGVPSMTLMGSRLSDGIVRHQKSLLATPEEIRRERERRETARKPKTDGS